MMNLKKGILPLMVVAVAMLSGVASAQRKVALDTPALACVSSTTDTITLSVTAGATGAPSGFSVQWMPASSLAAGFDGVLGTADDGIWHDGEGSCRASFSGNANGSNWNLGPNGMVTVLIGGLNDSDPGVSFSCNTLECDTEYVFRTFAHAQTGKNALGRSAFSNPIACSTDVCDGPQWELGDFCSYSIGRWVQGQGGTADITCVVSNSTGITLGQVAYTWAGADANLNGIDDQYDALLAIVNGQTQQGGVRTRWAQVLALKMNILLGGNCDIPGGFGDLTLCGFGEVNSLDNDGQFPLTAAQAAALNGTTIAQFAAAADAWLVTGVNPYGLSSGQFATLLGYVYNPFENDGVHCNPGHFAEYYLCP